MRVFPIKGALLTAVQEADKIQGPINLETAVHKDVISFFQFVHCNVPNAPSNGTGRTYPLKSEMAEEIFGKPLSLLLYAILNKFANNASGKTAFFVLVLSFLLFLFYNDTKYSIALTISTKQAIVDVQIMTY